MSAMEFLRKNRMMITVVGVVLLILVRMLVLLLGTDAVNGYSNSVFWSVCQIAIALLFVLVLVLPVLARGNISAPLGDSRGVRISAGMAAAVFFVYTIVSLIELWMQFNGALMMYQLQIPWTAILKIILSILSVGFFYLMARCGSVLPSASSLYRRAAQMASVRSSWERRISVASALRVFPLGAAMSTSSANCASGEPRLAVIATTGTSFFSRRTRWVARTRRTSASSSSSLAIFRRMWRRSVSSWVSPGPRVPMAPS
jgi:hypothetical protein